MTANGDGVSLGDESLLAGDGAGVCKSPRKPRDRRFQKSECCVMLIIPHPIKAVV